eukprot:scaffold51163_cov29-Tisochrysis_lutea.AAC.7
MEESGPSHDRMYKVGCYINEVCIWDAHLGVLVATARGHSITDAQMGAALHAQDELHLSLDD